MVMLSMNAETAELQFDLGDGPCPACPATAHNVAAIGILGAEPPYAIHSTDVVICRVCGHESQTEPVDHASLEAALVRLPEPTGPNEMNGADLAVQVLGDIAENRTPEAVARFEAWKASLSEEAADA